MQELILLLLIFISTMIVYIAYKVFEDKGLLYSIIILTLMSYILTFKISIIFNSNVNLGIIPLLGSFTAIYIYLSKYDYSEYNKIIKTTLLSNIAFGILLIITNNYIPSITDTVSMNISTMVNSSYKLIIVFPILVAITQYAIGKLFKMLQKIKTNTYLSVVLTYIITAVICPIIFYIIAYINILPIKKSLFLGISTYILGLIITLLEALFVYLITKKKVKK